MIEFDSVTKRYGNHVVIDELSIPFYKGQTHVICGRSGAGKSTLIRCINGLESIEGGTIRFKGARVGKGNIREIRKKVAMVFQNFNLFPHLKILDNLTLGPVKVLGIPRQEAEADAVAFLKQVDLGDKVNRYPYQLSGGQKQRVAIVRSLVMKPELILFDEPTSALDPEMIGEVLEAMKALSEQGRSMIVVSHEMGFAREAADQVSFMSDGKMVETSPPDRFFNDPEHEMTQQFLKQIL
ncbi:MAG: amino acid ABC transporter ATP-binding protein [Desulfobacterales bacterium]|nr:amino acid ABC transporter ATP-binding protein [Desulfobacterales bacterium]